MRELNYISNSSIIKPLEHKDEGQDSQELGSVKLQEQHVASSHVPEI